MNHTCDVELKYADRGSLGVNSKGSSKDCDYFSFRSSTEAECNGMAIRAKY